MASQSLSKYINIIPTDVKKEILSFLHPLELCCVNYYYSSRTRDLFGKSAIKIQSLFRKYKLSYRNICYGCKNLLYNQQAHMDYGGCLYVDEYLDFVW